MEMVLYRDVFEPCFTLGRVSMNGKPYGFSCEDTDRKLENGGEKIPGATAIPRGRYRLVLSLSKRFKKIMPELLDVPGFAGIRVHGGNTAEDTEGCILLGAMRMKEGVRHCAPINSELISTLLRAREDGEECWLEVR